MSREANQQVWNYIGQNGKVAIVALQHDRRSGDLVVFYGKDVLWAERAVRTAQTISFFIDDELCKIHIGYEPDGRIGYEFEIDKKADTPLNRIRKTEERKGFVQGLGFLVGIVGILASVVGVGFLYNKYADAKSLREAGRDTYARLTLYPKGEVRNCTYTFLFNGIECVYGGNLRQLGDSLVLPCGMPAHNGDEVMIRFDPNELTNHDINWDLPSPDCAMSLVRRLRDRLLVTHPHLMFTQAECLAIMAHRLGGFHGMADMYYGTEPMFNNLYHNQMTFGLQQQRGDFKDDVGECF
jgi:hypothetical protein